MRNVALRIEYDGTDFLGSQWQQQGRTVQGVLEDAWLALTQEQQRVILAGRTDAGVHARGQVANVQTSTEHDLFTLLRGLNALLPHDVAVHQVWDASADFHARHSAIQREYRYVIDNGRVPAALLRRHASYVERKLDLAAMSAALQALPGRHDFAEFCDGPVQGSTVRTCQSAECHTEMMWGQRFIVIEIAANAFLRHMVRNIVGMLLLVGEGRAPVETLAEALEGKRRKSRLLAPAHGLYLMNVVYPGTIPAEQIYW